jgi:hypothetical protein
MTNGGLLDEHAEAIHTIEEFVSQTMHLPPPRVREEFDRDGVVFRWADASDGDKRLLVSREFLDDNRTQDVPAILARLGVADELERLPTDHTLVLTNDGVSIEETEPKYRKP